MSNARWKPAVFILEPQTLFVSDLKKTIARCGGHVVRVADRLENVDLASLHADVAILDLDDAADGVLSRLGSFRVGAPPNLHVVVMTSKACTPKELASALRRILSGAMFYDPRVDAA